MRRTYILFVIIITVLLSACSDSIEGNARKRLKPYVESIINEYEVSSFEIKDVNTDYSGDSICILHFVLDGKSVYNEKVEIPMEYILTWTVTTKLSAPKLEEAVFVLSRGEDGDKPLRAWMHNFYDGMTPKDSKEYEHSLRTNAAVRMFFRKHVVE